MCRRHFAAPAARDDKYVSTAQPQRIFSVTDLTRSIKGILESSFNQVTVVGEVSNLRQPYSGHLYFTLKDEGAQLRSVFFKMQQRYSMLELADGMQIICRGRISVYEARGEYQLIVDTVEQYGLGKLQQQFEQLKKRLLEEGLFAADRKKPLPSFPARIALVTSPTGAAVHDFLQTASRNGSVIFRFSSCRCGSKERGQRRKLQRPLT